MVINVEKLKSEISDISSLIEDNKKSSLNFYNAINTESTYWKDGNSPKFFENCSNEKLDVLSIENSLNSFISIYNSIIKRTENIGNKISYNASYKDSILRYFDNYISRLNLIVSMYNSMDLSNCPNVYQRIINQMNTFDNIKNRIISIKNSYENYFSQLDSIEVDIGKQLNDFSVPLVSTREKDRE